MRNRVTFANVPPTLSLVMTSDMVIYMILRPNGPESLEMDTGILLADGAMQDPAFEHKMDMTLRAVSHIVAQVSTLTKWCSRGCVRAMPRAAATAGRKARRCSSTSGWCADTRPPWSDFQIAIRHFTVACHGWATVLPLVPCPPHG
jgi:hypothetical protein